MKIITFLIAFCSDIPESSHLLDDFVFFRYQEFHCQDIIRGKEP